jgi:hypothetical protein
MGLSEEKKVWLNTVIGLVYVSWILALTGFWPSSSLIFLVALHFGGAIWVAVNKQDHEISKGVQGILQIFSWHHVPAKQYGHIHYFMAIAHLFIVFVNMLGFLEVTIKEMPPSTIRFGGEMQLDHTRFEQFQWC